MHLELSQLNNRLHEGMQKTCEAQAVLEQRLPGTHLRSLGAAMTRSQSRTLCFFRYFFVKYLRYLQGGHMASVALPCLRVCLKPELLAAAAVHCSTCRIRGTYTAGTRARQLLRIAAHAGQE